jgi:hypothetical protein
MSESNFGFNFFIVIFGFCILCIPIIFISLSSAPPPVSRFDSVITFNTISDDTQSPIYLNQTATINGSTVGLFDEIILVEQLSYINNITELIETEKEFLRNVSMKEYGGFSKKIHLFMLELNITESPNTSLETQQKFAEMFGEDNGTFISYLYGINLWHSFTEFNGGYPDVNQTIEDLYTLYDPFIEYMVTIDFFADIIVDGERITTEFSRILLLSGVGQVMFFITNEIAWTAI